MITFYRKTLEASGIDPKFFDMVSQFAHFWTMFGISVIVVKAAYFTGHPLKTIIVCGALQFLYAVWHEFWYDPHHEDAETRGSDLEDFVFLVGGAVLGYVVEVFLP